MAYKKKNFFPKIFKIYRRKCRNTTYDFEPTKKFLTIRTSYVYVWVCMWVCDETKQLKTRTTQPSLSLMLTWFAHLPGDHVNINAKCCFGEPPAATHPRHERPDNTEQKTPLWTGGPEGQPASRPRPRPGRPEPPARRDAPPTK